MPNLLFKTYKGNKMRQSHGFSAGLCLVLAAQYREDSANWLKLQGEHGGRGAGAFDLEGELAGPGLVQLGQEAPSSLPGIGRSVERRCSRAPHGAAWQEGEKHKLSIKGGSHPIWEKPWSAQSEPKAKPTAEPAQRDPSFHSLPFYDFLLQNTGGVFESLSTPGYFAPPHPFTQYLKQKLNEKGSSKQLSFLNETRMTRNKSPALI